MKTMLGTAAWHTLAILFVALSLSIGWGVRGNWGHEFGAMIPGALAAMAACLVSGRDDWWRRAAYFAFFGALGWSFGGAISYMMIIAYTHSGDFAYGSVPYGFACLFLVGFLWASIGGAGTALPAALPPAALVRWFPPIVAVLVVWLVQGIVLRLAEIEPDALAATIGEPLARLIGLFEEERLNWHDTDWLAALTAPLAVLLWQLSRWPRREAIIRALSTAAVAAVTAGIAQFWLEPMMAGALGGGLGLIVGLSRGRLEDGAQLVTYMAAGWWLGFLILTELFGLSMTPPRSENWSGGLGMTVGMFAFLLRHRLMAIVWSAAVAGFFGGLGFSGATLLKLAGIRAVTVLKQRELELREAMPDRNDFWLPVWQKAEQTNWHSILEQSFGFISGIGIAVVLLYLARRIERQPADQPRRHWSETFCLLFVLLGVTYLNLSKNVGVWRQANIVADVMYGLSPEAWFAIGYGLLALKVGILVWWHRHRHPLAIVPESGLGRAEALFLLFLWWIVLGNLMRTPPFAEQRLITEGVIHLHAVLVTLLALLLPKPQPTAPSAVGTDFAKLSRRAATILPVAFVLIVVAQTALVRAMWGETFVGHAGHHIRFGPAATHLDQREIERQQQLRWGK